MPSRPARIPNGLGVPGVRCRESGSDDNYMCADRTESIKGTADWYATCVVERLEVPKSLIDARIGREGRIEAESR